MENNKKPNDFHCIIIFWSDYPALTYEKQILIEDEKFLTEVLSIGYTKNDAQALVETDFYKYLTLDLVSLVEESIEPKNIKLLNLVKSFIVKNDLQIPEEAKQFNLSFPGELIGGKNWEIKEWDDLVNIVKQTIEDPEEQQKQIAELDVIIAILNKNK